MVLVVADETIWHNCSNFILSHIIKYSLVTVVVVLVVAPKCCQASQTYGIRIKYLGSSIYPNL